MDAAATLADLLRRRPADADQASQFANEAQRLIATSSRQLEELRVKMPDEVNLAQHYDVFVHVYVKSPLADRRVAPFEHAAHGRHRVMHVQNLHQGLLLRHHDPFALLQRNKTDWVVQALKCQGAPPLAD